MFSWKTKEEEVPVVEAPIELEPEPEPIVEKKPEPVVIKNPGSYHLMRHEADEVTNPKTFDGLRFQVIKALSQNWEIHHTIGLGSAAEPSSYSFQTFWAPFSTQKTWILAKMDTEGQFMSQMFHQFANWKTKIIAQTSNQPHSSVGGCEVDYEGSDWQGSLKWSNPGNYSLSYHQAITKHLSLASCFDYKHQHGFAGNSYGVRYNADKWIGTFMAMPANRQYIASYTQKVSDTIALASKWAIGMGREGFMSVMSVGLECKFRGTLFQANIDTSGKVSSYFEEGSNRLRYTIGAELDHKKKQYKFGMGLSISL